MRPHELKKRAALALATIAGCGLLVAGSTRSVAQFPFPNPQGAVQDAAVRAALSSFGKAVGDQLPIVVSPSDAYPTVALPGPAFAPRTAPSISASLRVSTDGTVALAPGDYAFTVDVFCMQAHAGSPSAHRYLVAPLRGAAADIFRALNSRAPSYRLDHHTLQVLSWYIQAGLPYSAMRPAQRAIVDQVIPDFRQRLEGDVYTRIRAQYDQTAAHVPGMPSFDGALSRLGPTGQAILTMQRLRDEMAQPPPTFEELARELVPTIPLERGGSGVTPWSRYSDRVYIRFVTSGNYATPGTYEVRVLAAQDVSSMQLVGLGPPSSGAPVPFTNTVNNPGTSSVQPLTQTPTGNAPPGPSPSPSPSAFITSQTEATEPADRTRLTVGVRELVKLTFSGGAADWSLAGNGKGSVDPNGAGTTATYEASIIPATETITAVDKSTHASATITFTVIQPSGLSFEIYTPGMELHHKSGRPDIGFSAHIYLQPDTVSFQRIVVREKDAAFSATGYYVYDNGVLHCRPSTSTRNPCRDWVEVKSLVPSKGWLLDAPDDVYSGSDPSATPPFTPGYESVFIPWEYSDSDTHGEGPYTFAHVSQSCELARDRSTITASKGNAKITLSVSSPDYY